MAVKNVMIGQEKRIRDLRFFCIGLFLVVLWQTKSLSGVNERLTVHIPPQLERGAILNPGEVPKPNVYSFSYYVFQKLNTWEKDGFTEAPVLLDVYRCYLTPDFAEDLALIHKERSNRGETRNRKRIVREASHKGFDPASVVTIDDSKWVVKLDMHIQETIDDTLIKDVSVRFPLLVVKDDTSPDCNPWGIKFAGFDSAPKRIIRKGK
jgi:integrating conjugative element protein (TIGR03746 family)